MEDKSKQTGESGQTAEQSPTANVAGSSAAPRVTAEVVAAPVVVARRGSGLVAWLALLVALAGLALAGWIFRGMQQDRGLPAALSALQTAASSDRRSLQNMQQQNSALEAALQAGVERQLAQMRAQQADQLRSLEAALQTQRQQLQELGNSDRNDWALAEAEYLLRLAQQRLIMAGDVRSAVSMLQNADAIAKKLDDSTLHALRAAIAADIAQLRAVPAVDTEGVWLRIQALTGTIDKLLLFELPQAQVAESQVATTNDWQQRLQHGLAAALNRLSNYVVIRRRDATYQALLDPQWERLVRQNLRMLLEQSQTALLSGNAELYQLSLANTRHWLAEFFAFNEAAVRAADEELALLQEQAVAPVYPDLAASLVAVKAALAERRRAAGGN